MNWIDIAGIVFVCVTMNHLGLISAVEGIVGFRIYILNCPKCASFWVVLICSLCSGQPLIASVAVSFLCAYAALWLELLCGYIDTLYNKLYESIYPKTNDDTTDTQG